MTQKTSQQLPEKKVRKPDPDPSDRKPRRREPVENVVVKPIDPPAVGDGIKRGDWRGDGYRNK